MPNLREMILLAVIAVAPLVSACSQNKKQATNQGNGPGWSASFDSLGQQFQHIRQTYMQDSTRMSPQARMVFHNMQSLWGQMGTMRAGMMQNGGNKKGRGMMGNQGMMNNAGMMGGNRMGNGMMGSGSMMRFNEMNQQMLSYCQGLQQMMSQSGNTNMAGMYGQMAGRMKAFISQLPEDTTTAPASPEGSTPVEDGSVIFASNCSPCHGSNGKGMRGVFPPLNGSPIVTGDKNTIIKILLNGLQGQVTVARSKYNGIMPSFGKTLSDAQIAAVLTYVRSLPDNKAGNVTTDEVQNVRKETNSRRQAWTPGELGLK